MKKRYADPDVNMTFNFKNPYLEIIILKQDNLKIKKYNYDILASLNENMSEKACCKYLMNHYIQSTLHRMLKMFSLHCIYKQTRNLDFLSLWK